MLEWQHNNPGQRVNKESRQRAREQQADRFLSKLDLLQQLGDVVHTALPASVQ